MSAPVLPRPEFPPAAQLPPAAPFPGVTELRPAAQKLPGASALRWLLAIVAVFLVREAQALLAPIAIAVVLTFVLSTPVHLLRRHGIPEFIGAAVLVLALIGSTALVGTILAGPASEWWEKAPTTVDALVEQTEKFREAIGLPAPPAPPPSRRSQAPAPEDPVKERLVSESVALTGLVIGRAFSFSLSAIATVILLYFLLASEHWLLSRTVEAFSRRRTRALLLGGVRNAQREIGRFIGALSIINFGVALVTMAFMAYIGLPSAALWGSLAGVLSFIPYIGPILTMGLLLLAGVVTFTDNPALMLAPAAGFMVIHAIESNLVSPWFIGRRLALSRISVFLSVMLWGWMWGIAGAVLAVPFLIGFRSLCRRVRKLRRVCVYLDEARKPPPSLSYLLTQGVVLHRGSLLRGVAERRAPQKPPE